MATTPKRLYRGGVNPFHGLVLGGTFPLFLGAALADYAYATSYHIQWQTFASWLLAGGLVFTGLAILFALAGIFVAHRKGLAVAQCLLLIVTWVLGFVGALIHARDAWAMMPTGFVLSVVVAILALVAVILGFSRVRVGGES